MNEHPEDSTPDHKLQSVEDAVANAKRNYGEEIDYECLIGCLEDSGWVYRG